MPLYEYECTACHRRTEKIQKFSDPELTTCPFCQGPLERTLTAPAIQFKGSGWYKDLYSSAKPPSSKGEEGAAAPAGDTKSGGAGEAGGASGSPDSSTGKEGAASSKSDATPAAPKSAPATAASGSSSGATSSTQ